MMERQASVVGRILGIAAVVLYLVVGVVPYAASGLVAPFWAIIVLYALWAVGLVLAIQWARAGSAWALAMPVAAIAVWWMVMRVGEALLGWTA